LIEMRYIGIMQQPRNNTPQESSLVDRLTDSAGWTRVLMPQRRLRHLYESSRDGRGANIFESLLRALEVNSVAADRDIGWIPKTGAAIVVANHPFGMLDGLLIGSLLLRVRSDVKIVANRLLASIPELSRYCIYVDAMDGKDKQAVNTQGLRESIRHLTAGGLLVLFPAGEVAHWSLRSMSISESRWNDSAARLAQMTGSPVVPVCIHGTNSFSFHASGLIHPMLRTFQLPHELLNKRGQRVTISVGQPVKAEKLRNTGNSETATSMLRWSTDLLALRAAPRRRPWRLGIPRSVKPIGRGADPSLLAQELRSLPPKACLQQQGEFDVYELAASQAPNIVREIGRLREISFRQAGEGTGSSFDLDRFDDYYTHFVLWNRELRQIAGGYRLGNVREILQRFGTSGLYTATLFRYGPSFFESIGGALELGRSFITPEYQRHYLPLLQLWKGIGVYLVRHPESPILFGAVSISNVYSPASREVMTAFLRAQRAPQDLVDKVGSRVPFHRGARCAMPRELNFSRALTMSDVSERVSGLEADGKDLPILVKHYLRLGGKTLALAVDPKFSDVLDALIMVNLRTSDPVLLSKYLGKSGARAFAPAS
jgi:putative hemolysin